MITSTPALKISVAVFTVMPEPPDWEAKSEDQSVAPDLRSLLRRLAALRAERDEVLVLKADFNKPAQVEAAVNAAIAQHAQRPMKGLADLGIERRSFGPDLHKNILNDFLGVLRVAGDALGRAIYKLVVLPKNSLEVARE